MKKLVIFALLLTLTASAFAFSSSALVEAPELSANYGHPVIDGEIDTDIYSGPYVMNSKSASAWVGSVGKSSVSWYFAWDEGGLYYAGHINDVTPTYRKNNAHWVGIDCLEIAINPGDILTADDRTEGIFFSFGATKDGKIVAWRHNFADGLVSDSIQGAASGHKSGTDGYTIEVYIPWSLVQLDTDCTIGGKTDISLDSTGFKPTSGTTFSVLPCAIDATDADTIAAAYKFNDTDFTVRDFLKLTLGDKPEETTVPETAVEITTVAETAAEETTVAETTAAETKSGCNSYVAVTFPIISVAMLFVCKKKD